MFDDLRNTASAQEDEEEVAHGSLIERMPFFKTLTPQQRFIIALFLFLNVAVLGFACLAAFDIFVF